MSQNIYRLLKQQDPTQHIALLAPKSTLALATRMSEIDEIIEQPLTHGQLQLIQRWRLGKTLRDRFQRAFILPNSLKSALISWIAKIPHRIGWLGEQRHLLLNDIRKLDKATYPLLIERYAALAFPKNDALPTLPSPLPLPRLRVDLQNQQNCLARLNLVTNAAPILALCPGAEYGPSKRWPVEYFAEIANHYLQAGWQVWLFGGPKEGSMGVELQELTQQKCSNLINQTSLLDAIDLLALTTSVLTNDSGLMHMACALEKPVVALYGSSSPGYTPPLGERVKIVTLKLSCSPCFQRECPLTGEANMRCLLGLKPKQAIVAIEELLA